MEGSATTLARRPANGKGPRRGLPPGPRTPRTFQTAQLLLRPTVFAEDCRRRFGETFTVRTRRDGDMVFISDPDSLKDLFGADRAETTTPNRPLIVSQALGPRSLFVLESQEHLRRRKLMLPPFHGERMRAYEGMMVEATQKEIDRWPDGVTFSLHSSMRSVTFEVILRAVFGIDAAERRAELENLLDEILDFGIEPSVLGLVAGKLRRVVRRTQIDPRWSRAHGEANAILERQIAERRADPDLSQREDILSMLLSARFDDGSAMDDGEVCDQLMTLVIAGHETTATALAWTFDLLLHRPDKLERLTAEIAAADEQKYLDAVIEETLRVRPLVTHITRRLSTDTELGGWELPAGTSVSGSISLAHTREESFPEPYEFKPERFLESKPETYSWIPFGGGVRRCIGAAFALQEMRVVLRTVLGGVRLEPGDPDESTMVRRHITIAPRNGMPAVVAERL